MAYYEYIHRAGYGRDDHMADEIIARAARILGYAADGYIARAAGLASHPVPLGGVTVRLQADRGARQRMLSALRATRREVLSNDCHISIVRMRVRYEDTAEVVGYRRTYDGRRVPEYGRARVIEEHVDGGWREVERTEDE